jgi:Ca-activated chloride channel family protein
MDLRTLGAIHFLHPLWLLALPVVLAWILWLRYSARGDAHWRRIVDPALLSLLRVDERGGGGVSAWSLVCALWVVAVLALAGPAWTRLQMPAFRSQAAWVLVLDLSPSMSATDTSPTRVTRARYAAADLLAAARDARVGLIAFAGEPHVVAPLTTDVATVRMLLTPLSPALMPEPGDRLAPALSEARRLLQAESARHGQVIVLSDGFSDPAESLRVAQELRQEGMTVHCIGVGTEAGAPEPDGKGGFVTGSNGQPRISREQTDELERVARAGGGELVQANAVASLLPALEASDPATTGARSTDTRTLSSWRNEGVWLLPVLLLLASLLVRRGWV